MTMVTRRATVQRDTTTMTLDDTIGALGMENKMIEGTIDEGAV
jgi:hypothetical protein